MAGGYKSADDKANNKYSLMARYGVQWFCQQALLDLRDKLNASGFEAVAYLYDRVSHDLYFHEKVMIERLLSGDDLEYYKSVHL